MRRKLKEFFDKAARFVRKQTFSAATATTTLTLGAAGAVSTVPMAAAATTTTIVQPVTNDNAHPDLATDTLYWKHKDYDIVIRSQPGANNSLNLTVDYINLHDDNNRELMAMFKGYYREEGTVRTGPRGHAMTRHVVDTERVRDWELQSFVGYRVNVNLEQVSDHKWRGTIRSPFNWQTYGLDVKQLDDDTVKVSGYFTGFPLLKLSEKATRVDNPPQQPPYNWGSPSIG